MVFPGVEVGIQLRFINKMEERSPSCVVLPGHGPAYGPLRGLCCSCERAGRREPPDPEQSHSQPGCKPSEEPNKGARSKEQGLEQNVWG